MTQKNKHKEADNLENTDKTSNEALDGVVADENSKVEPVDFQGMYLRALADYQNLLRQTAKEKEDFARFANEHLVIALLPVYDNLKTSLKHIDDQAEKTGWAEGIKYVVKQFADALESIGVKEIKTLGEKFDHHKMDAVSEKETADHKLSHLVAEELTAGYELKGKVIRAARVTVYKHTAAK